MKAYIGQPMRHREELLWHLIRTYVDAPPDGRTYVMYCGVEIPLLAAIMGELRPLLVGSAINAAPCDQCVWQQAAALRDSA